MPSPIGAMTELAEAVYPDDASILRDDLSPPGPSVFTYTILAELQRSLYTRAPATAQFQRATEALSDEPDLALFRHVEGQLDPMVFCEGTGSRYSLSGLVGSILLAAAQRIYYLRMEYSKPSFVRTVLENYEELLRAGRGEAVRAYSVIGFTGIKLGDSAQVQTPWGTLRAATDDVLVPAPTFVRATAVLSGPRLTAVTISRDNEPVSPPVDQQALAISQRARQLLPLAFALATIDGPRCAPMAVFETTLTPILPVYSFSLPGMHLRPQQVIEPTANELRAAEDWSRRLEQEHEDNLQVAERRIVSAIAERFDKADSLIDAVIAWESIVGTRTETVFRVTAALTRLLEADPTKRSDFRQSLSKIYDTRSRVVHGELVDPANIASASDDAINIGLRTLRELYSRTPDWRAVKSGDRADRIILGE
jgi:hypothetical protein